VAVLTTMLSTSLTVVDGFPRAIERSVLRLARDEDTDVPIPGSGRVYWTALVALATGTLLVLGFFAGSLTAMVDFATIVSFITAPILGWLNLRAVTSQEVPPEHRPGRGMLTLSWVGLLLLGGTAVVYAVSLLG
ncbi:MAG: divalent metal cation transporter, partial [Gemmatimonadetes bacterium]|nr:divalent metal cation transporter [Gemmatimonadota bacterium]